MPQVWKIVAGRKKGEEQEPLPLLETGDYTAYIVKTDGRAFGWGFNAFGQIGDNTTTVRYTPVSVAGAVKTFCKITGGQYHASAIDKNGKAWGWGYNFAGAIGDNSVTSRRTPVSVGGAVKTFCQIRSGGNHTLAIDKNGKAWGWGYNQFGMVGDNSLTNRCTPVSVAGATKTFCKIDGSGYHSAAIDKNGQVWAWGYNQYGQLGNNSTASQKTPVSVLGATKTFCQISLGMPPTGHTVAIDKNGKVWGWGFNGNGQLGDNSITQRNTPVSVLGATKTFCQISAGGSHTVAIDKNGQIWGWGNNTTGQLGNNSTKSARTPVSVLGTLKTFCSISAGFDHTVALDKDGQSWAWGDNNTTYGVLGINFGNDTVTPVSVKNGVPKTFCSIAAGYYRTTAIDAYANTWTWGYDNDGQSGTGFVSSYLNSPTALGGFPKVFMQLALTEQHSLALDTNGSAYSWGNNSYGQLGNNSTTKASTPVAVYGFNLYNKIAAGANGHSLAIDSNGQVWGWGLNTSGQLGDNSTTSRRTPVSIAGSPKTFCHIHAGNVHSVAIDKNGRAWSWGDNSLRQLGDGSFSTKCTPVSVAGTPKTFCNISTGTGHLHTAVIDQYGEAWGWGYNQFGALGDGTISLRCTPVAVYGGKTFCKISVGHYYTVALDNNGKAWGWGYNTAGQLGDGTKICRCTPVSVAGTTKTFCEIYAGADHTVALDNNGKAWGWGNRQFRQLGDSGPVLTPVRIYGL
jgi:alpha-tubulin suppressor-like RCC1 family protein